MIELQKCTSQEVWDDYILENGGHPLQLWGWGQLKSAHGWSVDRMFGLVDDQVVAAAQILTRKLPLPLKAFSYVPRGPIGGEVSGDEFLTAIADYTKRTHHSVVLSLEPNSTDMPLPEDQVAAPQLVKHFDVVRQADFGRLHIAVTRAEMTGRHHRDLHQARTVHAEAGLAAPQIGRADEALGDADEIAGAVIAHHRLAQVTS